MKSSSSLRRPSSPSTTATRADSRSSSRWARLAAAGSWRTHQLAGGLPRSSELNSLESIVSTQPRNRSGRHGDTEQLRQHRYRQRVGEAPSNPAGEPFEPSRDQAVDDPTTWSNDLDLSRGEGAGHEPTPASMHRWIGERVAVVAEADTRSASAPSGRFRSRQKRCPTAPCDIGVAGDHPGPVATGQGDLGTGSCAGAGELRGMSIGSARRKGNDRSSEETGQPVRCSDDVTSVDRSSRIEAVIVMSL